VKQNILLPVPLKVAEVLITDGFLIIKNPPERVLEVLISSYRQALFSQCALQNGLLTILGEHLRLNLFCFHNEDSRCQRIFFIRILGREPVDGQYGIMLVRQNRVCC